jgi:hypothetical protein
LLNKQERISSLPSFGDAYFITKGINLQEMIVRQMIKINPIATHPLNPFALINRAFPHRIISSVGFIKYLIL